MPFFKPVSWVKFLIYALLLSGLYYSSLKWLIIKDWSRDSYNYAYLIPFITLYLFWEKRYELAAIPSSQSSKGVFPLIIGIILFWLGELGGEFLTLYISLWLVLVGLYWIHNGWRKLKIIGFCFIFMLTMFPLPNFFYTKLMFNLRLISSHLGVAAIQFLGIPAYREGNIINLSFAQLQVVEACSGLHSLISLFVLGLLMAYLFKAHFWKRVTLLISTVPLAIFLNSMRITITSLLYLYLGPEIAQGFFHGFSSLLIFLLCIPFLLLEIWFLGKLPPPPPPISLSQRSYSNPQVCKSNPRQQEAEIAENKSIFQPLFIITAVILGLTLVLSLIVEFREVIPSKKPFDQFPLEVGKWHGKCSALEQRLIDSLDLSEYVIIDYLNGQGKKINFYAAYYETQRKGESIHSPATCLLGAGWKLIQTKTITIPLSLEGNEFFKASRALMLKEGEKRLCYYWFFQAGRILNNAYQMKIYTFWNSLVKQRSDAALIRLITPIDITERVDDADDRLRIFAMNIMSVLDEYIPVE